MAVSMARVAPPKSLRAPWSSGVHLLRARARSKRSPLLLSMRRELRSARREKQF